MHYTAEKMKPQLFLLPFAGGNRYCYNFLLPGLRDYRAAVLELPGRGNRINEDLIKNFELAADDYCDQIIQKLTGDDFIIYGHSMGASLGLRIAAMLEEKQHFPAYLFVTGNAGPGQMGSKVRYLLNDQEFKQELLSIGGVPEEALADEELFNFIEPILRADFECTETNEWQNQHPVKTPIYACMGRDEFGADRIHNWDQYTTSGFHYELFDGGHFFIYDNKENILTIFKKLGNKQFSQVNKMV